MRPLCATRVARPTLMTQGCGATRVALPPRLPRRLARFARRPRSLRRRLGPPLARPLRAPDRQAPPPPRRRLPQRREWSLCERCALLRRAGAGAAPSPHAIAKTTSEINITPSNPKARLGFLLINIKLPPKIFKKNQEYFQILSEHPQVFHIILIIVKSNSRRYMPTATLIYFILTTKLLYIFGQGRHAV